MWWMEITNERHLQLKCSLKWGTLGLGGNGESGGIQVVGEMVKWTTASVVISYCYQISNVLLTEHVANATGLEQPI